ncbi:MAG TPA: peptidylprolyl isomerase [Chitinophagaceae bacterium]|nr:peptidylprolyl isomerase [Chitinophagaceae bacterium]
MKRVVFLGLGLLVVTAGVAQPGPSLSKPIIADKIVAIVGNKIILQSDIDQQYDQLQKDATTPLPPDTKCAILEQVMDQKALILQGEIDSLPVNDDDVEGELNNRIRAFINIYGSREKLEQVAGKSVYQIKETYRPAIRESLIASAERRKIVEAVKITPNEVRAYYDSIPKDSLPFFPSQLEVGTIVINPKPSQEMEDYTISQLENYRKQIVSGQYSFQTIMVLYSKDPSRNQNDGVFPISRGDQNMDQNFLAAAFRLKDGEISPVVKSSFGYHLIQMVKRDGDNAQVRHILLVPPITTENIVASMNKLDSIRSNIIAGKANFGEEAVKFSDDPNAKMFAGMLTDQGGSTYLGVEELDPSVMLLVDSLQVGEISHPVTFSDARGNTSTRIVFLKSRSKPHQENLTDDYNTIQQKALLIRQNLALNDWFNKRVPRFYLMVDNDYKHCGEQAKWLVYAAKNQAGIDNPK